MEFIQKKTADEAVAHFLPKAADKEMMLAWDRFEGQLPECGFCESGLSCRDCLQGPCISHPFRDTSKMGVCGKDRHVLAVQSLLRLVLKGTTACLDQASEFAKDAGDAAAAAVKELHDLIATGDPASLQDFPAALVNGWKAKGICPEGLTRDLFKATQKLEGGVSGAEEMLLWTLKAALLGTLAKRIQGKIKQAVFGPPKATAVELNMGVLKADGPNILLMGSFSPILKQKIKAAADKKQINVAGVCSDPLLLPDVISPATTYGAQDVAVMTGAVDLIVAGDQFVNPSLKSIASDWRVAVVPTETLKPQTDLKAFADSIVAQALKAYDNRGDIQRDIPAVKATATMGHPVADLDMQKITAALTAGGIKGIVILAGSNNVKFTQDNEFVVMTEFFLENDFLCITEGEAGVVLGKHNFLNAKPEDIKCGAGLAALLADLGTPPVIDCDVIEFLLALAQAEGKALSAYPIFACFAEASRSEEATRAVSLVAMGVDTYFYPYLPVSGSADAIQLLTTYCQENFGAKLNIVTSKLSATEKAKLLVGEVVPPASMSGKTWNIK